MLYTTAWLICRLFISGNGALQVSSFSSLHHIKQKMGKVQGERFISV